MLQSRTSMNLPSQNYNTVPFPIATYPETVNQLDYTGNEERKKILQIQQKEVEDYMDKIINEADSVSNFTNTNDFKDFGLLPGQQIAYSGGFGLSSVTHHGVYIGNGIVAEVASQSCLRKCLINAYNFNTLCFGLSTLADFARRAEEKKSSVILYKHKGYDDTNPELIKKRLRRVKEIVSSEGQSWRQWVLTHNCESAANYVSYGTMETKQGQLSAITIIIAYALNNGLGGVAKGYYNKEIGEIHDPTNLNCKRGTCIDRNITTTGCVCETDPKYSVRYGNYCYVDGKICKSEKNKDYRGIWGTILKTKKMCLRNSDKKKYLPC